MPMAEESLYTGATISTEAAWRAIIDFQVSHKLTYSALNDLLVLLKNLCPAPNNCPRSTYLLKKHFEYVTDGCQQYTFCASCGQEIEGKFCNKLECRRIKQQYSHFITLPFEKHLKLIYSCKYNIIQYGVWRI